MKRLRQEMRASLHGRTKTTPCLRVDTGFSLEGVILTG